MFLSLNKLEKLALKARIALVESLVPAVSRHIGCSLSIMEILIYLYFREMKINSKNPHDKNRDIFILSKGHAALALYTVLYLKGLMEKKKFFSYDRNGSSLGEHTSSGTPYIEAGTGSLGHGLPIALGFALSYLTDNKKNKIYCLMSDGELNEGSNWEAIMFAGHKKLSNLTAIIDLNGYQGYSTTKTALNLSLLAPKFKDFGWDTYEADGHNFTALEKVFHSLKKNKSHKPKVVLAKTTKSKGVDFFEGKLASHYKSMSTEVKNDILATLKKQL